MTTDKLAKELRTIREVKKSSLREVEKATGISNAYLSQLERGGARNPSPSILYRLAEYYNVPYESLMESAGHLRKSHNKGAKNTKRPSAVQAALMSEDLSEEESILVAKFIEFLRSQHK